MFSSYHYGDVVLVLSFPSLCRDSMEAMRNLYNQVEEKVHSLVMRSNQSLQHLDYLLQLRTMEDKITLVPFCR